MKRKIFFFNNTDKLKNVNIYTKNKEVDLNFTIDSKKDINIEIEVEDDLFLKLLDKSHIYKLNLFTNSISFECDNIKFFNLPRLNYF